MCLHAPFTAFSFNAESPKQHNSEPRPPRFVPLARLQGCGGALHIPEQRCLCSQAFHAKGNPHDRERRPHRSSPERGWEARGADTRAPPRARGSRGVSTEAAPREGRHVRPRDSQDPRVGPEGGRAARTVALRPAPLSVPAGGAGNGRGRGASHPELCPGNVPGARLGAPSGAVVRAAGAPDRGHPFLCATCPAGAAAPRPGEICPPPSSPRRALTQTAAAPGRVSARRGRGDRGAPQRLPRWQVKTPVPHPPRAGVS